MKSIREIYNSLKEKDETIIFQVKTRKALNNILEELEEIDLEKLREILVNDYGAEKFWELIDEEE